MWLMTGVSLRGFQRDPDPDEHRRTTTPLPDATSKNNSYCPLTVMELEVPMPFATVTATEAILVSTVCPVGSVPAKVNGILNVN